MFTDSTEAITSQHQVEKNAKGILWDLENYLNYSPNPLIRSAAETEKITTLELQ